MPKRLIWGMPLLALVIAVSPAVAWHRPPYVYSGQSYQYSSQGVQPYYVPQAAQSYYVPQAVQSYQLGSQAVQSYQLAPQAYYVPQTVQSFQYLPLTAPASQSSAQAVQAQMVDILGLLDTIRKIADTLGGSSGGIGGNTTGLANRVAALEKRLGAVESNLGIKKSSPNRGTTPRRQFNPRDVQDEATAETVDDAVASSADPIQRLVDLLNAQDKAYRPAKQALDNRIEDTQDELNYLKDLSKRLNGMRPKTSVPEPTEMPKRIPPNGDK